MARTNLCILLSIAFLLKGVQLQQTADQKPKIVWASPVTRYSNQWNGVNSNDRQWMLPDPPTIINTPPPTTPAPTPPPAQPTPPPYQVPYQPPTTPSYPAPAPYQQPDPYQPPAAPSYPAPAPYQQPDPYQAPAPSPYYPPAAYEPPQAPPAQNGYYYYYYPIQKPEKPGWMDLFKKEKEALDAMSPGKHLSESQKIWIAVLAPLIVVALVVPLAALLFSNFTITAKKRGERLLNSNSTSPISSEFSEMAARAGALLESDECMQRIICSLGSYTSAVPGKSYLLSLLDNMVPDTMQNNMKIFREAANDEDQNCKRFNCSSWNF